MIPRPTSIHYSPGTFRLDRHTRLTGDHGVAGWLRRAINCPLPPGDGGIRLVVDQAIEGYATSVAPDRITIAGESEASLFQGCQTLRQLLPAEALRQAAEPGWDVPCVEIRDAPRFAWRGVLLDVARHFMPVPDVLRFVDLAAFHKFNVLHLHLTDDQGWRIEVPGWPRLTTVGAWRERSMLGSRVHDRYDDRPHGGFYTTGDLREIVRYAAERHITVVPEVDMPGHMQAAVAAYPQLGNGYAGPVRSAWGISQHVLALEALDFCRDVLAHVCEIFPSPVIGIGGDECPTGEWVGSAIAEREGLDRAQGWFTGRIAEFLAERGRRVLGWDEVLAGGAPRSAVIAAWRGVEPTVVAVRAGHQVVACPDISCYLDYRQSDDPGEPTPVGTLLTVDDVYRFDPVPPGLTAAEAALVIGGQANIWTEHMESARRVDYMAYPRLCAFAEVVWGTTGDLGDFHDRLTGHLSRLDALGVNYRPPSGPRPWDSRPDAPGHPRSRSDRLAELREMTADLRGKQLSTGRKIGGHDPSEAH